MRGISRAKGGVNRSIRVLAAGAALSGLIVTSSPRTVSGDDAERVLAIDHYVRVQSSVPSIQGQLSQIYVRERTKAGTVLRGAAPPDRVAVFVHGAGTPGSVAFDVPYPDYSWMAYLAEAGFDTFALDFTGYGRSTRPPAMNDPCNLSSEQQAGFIPGLLSAPCAPTYPHQLTTIASDWDDLGAVVDYVGRLRGVERVSLVAWSLGGPRAGGFAARHPEKIHRLVLLAPAFNRKAQDSAPGVLPAAGVPMNKQSREDFVANWDRQVGCPAQYEPAVRDAIWSDMLASDPVGATWQPGVRRAPGTTVWGWTTAVVGKMQVPTLAIAGAHDKQVDPARVREFFADLGSRQKVLVDLGCASHNAMWEKNHTLLFNASREWLTQTTVNGAAEGVVRLGY